MAHRVNGDAELMNKIGLNWCYEYQYFEMDKTKIT